MGSHNEKTKAAASSVLAAVFLTGAKIVVGVMTGSLGILAEAAHSALDLVAALVTFFAVRISDKPADHDHPYGHGKVENLSAFIETLLLLGTCVWIIYEAVDRLFFHPAAVEATVWAFGVIVMSIAIDISRSRMLYRVAKKHNSQALEADALHFSTDILSSGVVLAGLGCILVADRAPGLAFLHKMDAIAALFVALIVIHVSVKLGSKTIKALLDSAPDGFAEKICGEVLKFPEVSDCHRVRIRTSGPQVFVDLHITIDRNETLEKAHALTEQIETVIQEMIPGADVTVHPEPA